MSFVVNKGHTNWSFTSVMFPCGSEMLGCFFLRPLGSFTNVVLNQLNGLFSRLPGQIQSYRPDQRSLGWVRTT